MRMTFWVNEIQPMCLEHRKYEGDDMKGHKWAK